MNPKEERPKEDDNPFENLKIGNWEVLDEVKERSCCRICQKSRKYFCYSCYVPVDELDGKIPRLRLPIKIDIIKHRGEIDGKSTAAHAAVIASEDVKVWTYPFIPDFGSKEKVILIYPGKEANSIEGLFHPKDDDLDEIPDIGQEFSLFPITRAVFIDSTWNQSKGIYKDPRLRALPCVVLKSRLSQFWRHQKGSPRWYLATVEAIHQLLVELHENAWQRQVKERQGEVTRWLGRLTTEEVDAEEDDAEEDVVDKMGEIGPYDGRYDGLLFFFRYMYCKIHTLYGHETLLSYQRRLL